MPANSYPTSYTKVGEYNFGEWATLFNARFDDTYQQEIDRYGLGSHFMDGLMLAGNTTNISNRTPKVFERVEWEATVQTGSVINTGAAGANISFVINASDRDASGNYPVAVGDGLVIPAANQATGENRIYVITGIVTGTHTVTAAPLSADGNTVTESEISVAVASGTRLKIHSYYTGYGTGQPPGHNTVRAERTYYTQIIKTSMNYEGGINAIKWRPVKTESGINSAWMEGQELAENIHSKRMDDVIILGEVNDNAALVETSQWSGSNKRTATQGLWNWGSEAGQDLLYPGTWEYTHLYDYKDLIISQQVIGREVMYLYGTDLGRMIEESDLRYIREFSGGSDLFVTNNKLGINVKYFMGNGFLFQFQELQSFANPQRWGNPAYKFSRYGLMLPNQNQVATVDGKTERYWSITLGYLNHGGEDRTRIVRVLDGMSGRSSQAVDQYDGSNLYMLTEFVPIILRPNQIVRVLDETA
jgi:hypothetical protein